MSTLRALAPYLTTRRVLVAVAYFLVFISCGDSLSPGDRQVARIEVAPASLAMVVGATRSIVARVVDESGATVPASRIFWSTENPTIATVSQGGVVGGVGPGTTRIAVSSKGKSAIVPVTLSALQVTLVRVTPSTTTLRVGSSIALRADAFNAAGDTVSGRPVVWSSDNASLATVSSGGVASGVSPGTATISASVDGASGLALVTIQAVPVASVQVTPGTGVLFVGQALQLTATPVDSAGSPLTRRTITWASSAPAIATVSSTGLVNALAPGTATITANSEGRSGTSRITASLVPVSAVTIIPAAVTSTIGRRVQLAVRLADSSGAELTGRLVTWVSDQPSIAPSQSTES